MGNEATYEQLKQSIVDQDEDAVLEAVKIMVAEPERIARLWSNTRRMKEGLLSIGYDLGASETPILPVYVRDMVRTFQFCKHLEEAGVFVNPVVSPGVPQGMELLRVSLMATHTDQQIDFALDLFKKMRALPEWQEFMDKGAFNTTALAGDAFFEWLGKNEQMHRVLMKEAGFLAQ